MADILMSRQHVRDMKRDIKVGMVSGRAPEAGAAARTAALKLLDRSIAFGHCRLAVIRFLVAAEVGAGITLDRVRYREDAVVKCNDASLSQSFSAALKRIFVFPPADTL
ncbi:hypothetical protein C9I57_03570 [Trinickia symbiotica]|uniref:Uncharacterized protein n=1 Tax=Trinickia symbiotica TaxID=863227 RepID=A0A2T3XYZ5_9BURK|nr:hypothetical protein [Trinickia symbiotica]PTB21737.1 hypothetical protein C9I57_03570 [Trinickia symbiotica]